MSNYEKTYKRIEELRTEIAELKALGKDYSEELIALEENQAYLAELDWLDNDPSYDSEGDWLDNEFVYECGEDFDINFDVE